MIITLIFSGLLSIQEHILVLTEMRNKVVSLHGYQTMKPQNMTYFEAFGHNKRYAINMVLI